MRHRYRIGLVLLGLLLISALLAEIGPVGADDDEIQGVTWLTDLDAARAESRKTGRPILAVFR
jgi:hypothetical protein